MNKLRALLFILVVFLGVTRSQQVVKAEGMGGPNTGDYVYEDQEYITNEQYDRLEKINDSINTGVSPQKLYLLIFDNKTDDDHFFNATGKYRNAKGPENAIVGKTGEALFGESHYYDLESDASLPNSLDWDNNYLIMDLRNNRVYFDPSEQAEFYMTDLLFLRAQLGLGTKLKSANIDTKVAALFQLADRLEPKLLKVSQNKKFLKSKTIHDVKTTIGFVLISLGIIIVIIIWIIIHNKHKKDPHYHNGDSELGNSDYDAGFDEGYYMGSNDKFM